MTARTRPHPGEIRGRLDAEGRLVAADPALASLQRRAGGEEAGPLAVPQLAALARLARRLGIVVSRGVLAADGEHDLDLWVRMEPDGEEVAIAIESWSERSARAPADAPEAERQADFLRAAADWMWETDETLRFTALSPAAAAAVGKLPAELIGRQLTRLFRFQEGEDGALPILAALAEQRRFDDQYAELRTGSKGRYRLSGVPLIDGTGRFAGFRGAAASLPRWLPDVANDLAPPPPPQDGAAFGERLDQALRVPLDHIIASAETIGAQSEGPLRTDYAAYARDIAVAGRHLLALVDDLIDLQAIERPGFKPEAEPIDLAEIARRAASLMSVRAAAAQVRIDAPGEDETLPALGEFGRALQIMMNLLTNAIRYSPEGSMIWIRAEQEDDFACLIVADQGKGIAEPDQPRIFDKFERVDPAEPGGTGLGLYIARRLARAMGGDISVDSAPGQGARFTFTLPPR
ncbi:MAG TPA: PAS domain-containing sensor histidine kinase [Allosphingosinicella sp.]|nr:PAS domain-containing sensor histidine kinase [Allosphingosinicella sp.]